MVLWAGSCLEDISFDTIGAILDLFWWQQKMVPSGKLWERLNAISSWGRGTLTPYEMLPTCHHCSCLVDSQIPAIFPWPQMMPGPQTGTGTVAPVHGPPFLQAWCVFQPLHMSYTQSFMNLKLIIFPACQEGTPVLCACFPLHVLRPQWGTLGQQEIY